MGNWNSGRRPQPTALKMLRGNPGKRRISPDEPKMPDATASFDTPPDELVNDEGASKEWRRVAPILRACGLVTEAERTSLVALCQQWSRYLEAQSQVKVLGMIVQTRSGIPITNPYLDVADKALHHCHRLWTVLGLTPSGRARVGAAMSGPAFPAPPAPSKWQGLL